MVSRNELNQRINFINEFTDQKVSAEYKNNKVDLIINDEKIENITISEAHNNLNLAMAQAINRKLMKENKNNNRFDYFQNDK